MEALRRFKPADLRDLQVWFNLTWVHPLAFERDDALRELRDKGRNYTEDDKNVLLAKHLEILREVVPLHRRLAESGQVELTTTPFYHPILPLLFDKKLAREAMPGVALPNYAGGYPDDAAVHVRGAIEQHARLFGKPPQGMWPAEGSVCQSMLPLLAEHGVRWIATDEEILSASTHGRVCRDGKGHVNLPAEMYRPYKVREGDSELSVVFRDHALSDLIGFHYQHSPPEAAADDFMNCLSGIGQAVGDGGPALVSVILDGENCWEHYPGGGVDFLRASTAAAPRRRASDRPPSAISWSVILRKTRFRVSSPAAGSVTTSPSGSATRRTTRPGTPSIAPANISSEGVRGQGAGVRKCKGRPEARAGVLLP